MSSYPSRKTARTCNETPVGPVSTGARAEGAAHGHGCLHPSSRCHGGGNKPQSAAWRSRGQRGRLRLRPQRPCATVGAAHAPNRAVSTGAGAEGAAHGHGCLHPSSRCHRGGDKPQRAAWRSRGQRGKLRLRPPGAEGAPPGPKNASLPAPAAGTRALEPARLAGAGRRHAPARTSSLARRRGWHKS